MVVSYQLSACHWTAQKLSGLSLRRRSTLTTWVKHGAAAIRGATMTCILSFDCARDRFVHLELIIVRQFFARADVA